MPFLNDKVRIGPTGAQKSLFKMPGRGNKLRFGKRFELPEYFASLGLSAYEFPAGRMANFSDSPIYKKFRENSTKFNITISLHAPYYISLSSSNSETYEKSIERLAHTFAWATWLNAKRIVLHPGNYGKNRNTQKVLKMIIDGILLGLDKADEFYPELSAHFKNICLCPETMGKLGQLGPLDEVIYICKSVGLNRTMPCIDFGHIYARNRGKLTGRKLYQTSFELVEQELGKNIVENVHIHYSRIQYSQRGEIKHVPNNDKNWGPEITPLLEIVKENGYRPIIINESPELEPDAQIILKEWNEINQIE